MADHTRSRQYLAFPLRLIGADALEGSTTSDDNLEAYQWLYNENLQDLSLGDNRICELYAIAGWDDRREDGSGTYAHGDIPRS